MLSSSSYALRSNSQNWRVHQFIRHFSRSVSKFQDLSLGKLPFTSIVNLKIHDDHEPINLLPKYALDRLDFPPSGHIYYRIPEGRPSVASELRFRTEEGQDWTMANGLPWSLPIWRIVKDPELAPLKEFLIQDSIVTPEFIERCERLFPQDFATAAPTRVIFALRQPFPVHISRNKTTIWIVGEEKVLDLNIGSAWLGYPSTRQKNHKGMLMAELAFHQRRGYILRVVRPPLLASTARNPNQNRSIWGREDEKFDLL